MKKILILAYYFPPCIGIAANRPAAFANDFSKSHEVKVITRHWNGNEDVWTDYLASINKPIQNERINENLQVIRTPYLSKVQKPNKIKTLFTLLSGKLDIEIDTLQFYQTANEVIAEWKPDLILVSAPPKNLIRLARILHQKYQIPYIADFRDYENHITLMPERKKSFSESFQFSLITSHLRKDLKYATAITGVNQEICQFLSKISNKPSKVIYNGYEKSIFDQFIPIQEIKNDSFTVSIIGTVYPNQDLDIFLNAFNQLIRTKPELTIRFQFIGTSTIPEIGERIKKAIPEKYLLLTKKIPRIKALEYLENSHLVWQPEMVGYKGVYSGKIFEYLGAKRPILVAPSVGDVLDQLLVETKAGKSFKNSQEIVDYILVQYSIWSAKGFIHYEGDNFKINTYSRENQSSELLNWIQNLLQKEQKKCL